MSDDDDDGRATVEFQPTDKQTNERAPRRPMISSNERTNERTNEIFKPRDDSRSMNHEDVANKCPMRFERSVGRVCPQRQVWRVAQSQSKISTPTFHRALLARSLADEQLPAPRFERASERENRQRVWQISAAGASLNWLGRRFVFESSSSKNAAPPPFRTKTRGQLGGETINRSANSVRSMAKLVSRWLARTRNQSWNASERQSGVIKLQPIEIQC